jgi:hypothetical protein
MPRACGAATAALLACCVVLALSACTAAPWTPASFPNPATDVTLCNRRGVRSRICDPDGILSYEGANVLEATLADVAEARAPFGMSACARAPGEPAGYEVRCPVALSPGGCLLMLLRPTCMSAERCARCASCRSCAGRQALTRGRCGPMVQVAVALMAQMAVRDGLVVDDQAADFASALMTEWGVGNRRCNDGVLLLLSKEPREVRACCAAGPRPLSAKPAV